MSTTLTILRNRRKRRTGSGDRLEKGSRNLGVGCGFILSLLLIFGIFSLIFSYKSITSDLPSVETLGILLNPRDGSLLQPTRIYDRSGEHLIQVFAPEDAPRRYIPLSKNNPQHLPDSLAQATLVLIDPSFWEHPGYSLADLGHPESHPTLTQRLVADLLLWDEAPSLRRALRERILAAQLTEIYGRQQILEWWLNSTNYGHHAYGAEAAAQLYFEKSVIELDLAESATLAAINQIPALNPIDTPTIAYQRRQEALHILEALEMLDKDEADTALQTPFDLPSFEERGNPAPAFTRLIFTQLDTLYPRERIERGGLTITSTLDLDLQRESACAVAAQVARLSGEEAKPCSAARLLPTLPLGEAANNVHASAMLIDPVNGQILATVGETTLNGESANLAAHRAGSSLTPFIYLTGFTRGLSPASLLWDIPNEANTQNFDGSFHGPLRLRMALANDYLVPMEGVLAQMGSENVSRISRSFGLDFDVLASENALLSPLDMAQAFGVFAADGVMHGQQINENLQAVTILKIADAEGNTWLDWATPQSQPVVTAQLAYLMNNVLSDETARWPSLGTPNALEIGRPAAAKIGQLADGREAWTLGYTPRRVIVIWMGANEAFSPKAATGVWHALMQTASTDLPPEGWEAPIGVTKMGVCDPSGLLPTADCPNIVDEVFLNGSEPSQYDNLYRTFEVNRETGYLATVFTPPGLIEEKKYMLVPAEARVWAEAAGLTTPPDSYDAIQLPPRLPNANIRIPDLFADVSGMVEIGGTAAGENFTYYRLQVGQGLNPQGWTLVSEDIHEPVQGGTLATWDTSGLNGLYAIQLLVVQKDERLEIATTQVSIDNEPPTLRTIYPQEGEKLDGTKDRQIDIQVQANDNLGLDVVEFYIDFQQVGAVSDSPYTLTWATSPGNHQLKVVARDRAGNSVEESVRFIVER